MNASTSGRPRTTSDWSTDPGGAAHPPDRLTFWSALHFEMLKLRTLRSTVYLLGGCAFLLIAIGSIAALSSTGSVQTTGPGGGPPPFDANDPVATVLVGSDFATLLIGVFGCLTVAREYTSGMMRTSLTAVPRRLTALAAKFTAVLAASVVPATVGVFGAFLLGNAFLNAGGATSATLRDSETLRAVAGTSLYLVAIALLGLSLGVLLRSVATGISTLVAVVLIIPTFIPLLLPDSWDTVTQYLPSNAGAALSATSLSTNTSNLLSPTAAALVLAAWLVIALTAAAWSFTRRDP